MCCVCVVDLLLVCFLVLTSLHLSGYLSLFFPPSLDNFLHEPLALYFVLLPISCLITSLISFSRTLFELRGYFYFLSLLSSPPIVSRFLFLQRHCDAMRTLPAFRPWCSLCVSVHLSQLLTLISSDQWFIRRFIVYQISISVSIIKAKQYSNK